MEQLWPLDAKIQLNFADLENEINDMCDKDEIKEMLQQQLVEIEMLQAMYANPGEFTMDNYGTLADVNEFVAGKTSKIPGFLDFYINLPIGDKVKIHLQCTLTHEYPNSEPEVYVRSETFTRTQQKCLNRDLGKFVLSLARGELCIGHVIFWLQENTLNYSSGNGDVKRPVRVVKSQQTEKGSFTRIWIYSHHIYSKIKRREILSLAEDYALTGFVLPGKPGVICLEGPAHDCTNVWLTIRGMSWKKIACVKEETFELADKRFGDFKEVTFLTANDRHMDMGEFYKFLDAHGCAFIFKEYFGIDGKIGSG